MKPLSGFGEYRRLFWCVLVAVAGDKFCWPSWRSAYFNMTDGRVWDVLENRYVYLGVGPDASWRRPDSAPAVPRDAALFYKKKKGV